jgi:hypothetical protein
MMTCTTGNGDFSGVMAVDLLCGCVSVAVFPHPSTLFADLDFSMCGNLVSTESGFACEPASRCTRTSSSSSALLSAEKVRQAHLAQTFLQSGSKVDESMSQCRTEAKRKRRMVIEDFARRRRDLDSQERLARASLDADLHNKMKLLTAEAEALYVKACQAVGLCQQFNIHHFGRMKATPAGALCGIMVDCVGFGSGGCDSTVLSWLPSQSVLTEFLCTVASDWLPRRRFELLYRGSRDGMTAAPFHDTCDGQGLTLVLIAGQSEGLPVCVFGGYAGKSWITTNARIAVRAHDSFVFTVRNPFGEDIVKLPLDP